MPRRDRLPCTGFGRRAGGALLLIAVALLATSASTGAPPTPATSSTAVAAKMAPAAAAAGPRVDITHFQFGKGALVVRAGTTVTWITHDGQKPAARA